MHAGIRTEMAVFFEGLSKQSDVTTLNWGKGGMQFSSQWVWQDGCFFEEPGILDQYPGTLLNTKIAAVFHGGSSPPIAYGKSKASNGSWHVSIHCYLISPWNAPKDASIDLPRCCNPGSLQAGFVHPQHRYHGWICGSPHTPKKTFDTTSENKSQHHLKEVAEGWLLDLLGLGQ